MFRHRRNNDCKLQWENQWIAPVMHQRVQIHLKFSGVATEQSLHQPFHKILLPVYRKFFDIVGDQRYLHQRKEVQYDAHNSHGECFHELRHFEITY